MLQLLPEPKRAVEHTGATHELHGFTFHFRDVPEPEQADFRAVARLRLRGRVGLSVVDGGGPGIVEVLVQKGLDGIETANPELFKKQGYHLAIANEGISLHFREKAGFINGITSLKQLLERKGDAFVLPLCEVTDWPTVEHRAVSPTFSWYAGYGRIGFDMQLWGYDEWVDFLDACLDNKINQLNMVMYGYWPFEMNAYPETVFRDVPIDIWNQENGRWLTVRYSHPNIEKKFLAEFLSLAHRFEVKVLAYVGLNSYNGAYSIKHPDKRMVSPAGATFLNDFDSICLSDEDNVSYILACMNTITGLGFDGLVLEESEEGFWFCTCPRCSQRWGRASARPVEAKHKANMWLLGRIYDEVRTLNPRAIIGIRAFRQPPLEKDPAFLQECVRGMPRDIVLFWAPALYVPPTEFKKWIAAFGEERIWGRDTEANAITSTMGRLFRIFESNMIRYADEPNVQVIERDIEQHITSAEEGVSGINGFMFEWYGLFMFLWAHGNYGWGSTMDRERFFRVSCELTFGKELGRRVLSVLRGMLTIHESQIPLYGTPFPFQKNKIKDSDISEIIRCQKRHPAFLDEIRDIRRRVAEDPDLRRYVTHFDRIENAERRNAIIYDMVLAALRYENATLPADRERCLDDILLLNEKDFDVVKEMFFDINPVCDTGVKSCMFPYHEIKREIHNIRHPESPDTSIICSGIEALGWLWL